ncbi:MAG TPA: hypothetical protein VGM41_06875 [Chitinophagaceae bacterium]
MRKRLIAGWLILLSVALIALFWHSEWKYNLPTPVPVDYKAVPPGRFITINASLQPSNGKPVFLHFFNPDCPCSRFNIKHFKSLVKQYGSQVNFAIVAMTPKGYTAKDIQDRFDVRIPVVFDSSVAVACGVYSTPQAALIGTDHRLYYRGNYNRSRYCTDGRSNYAQMALDSLLSHKHPPVFDRLAITAYGCQLPNCTR